MRFQPISFTVNLSNGIYNYYENSVFVHPRLDKKVLSLHPEPLFFSAWGGHIVASVCNNTYFTLLDCSVFLYFVFVPVLFCTISYFSVAYCMLELFLQREKIIKL